MIMCNFCHTIAVNYKMHEVRTYYPEASTQSNGEIKLYTSNLYDMDRTCAVCPHCGTEFASPFAILFEDSPEGVMEAYFKRLYEVIQDIIKDEPYVLFKDLPLDVKVKVRNMIAEITPAITPAILI